MDLLHLNLLSIGGFIINPTDISSSESSLILNSDGRITGSTVCLVTKVVVNF